MVPRNRMGMILAAAAAGLLAPHPGGDVEVMPRSEGYSPPRPPREDVPRWLRKQRKAIRAAQMQAKKAGTQGGGLWRRNAAHGRVRGH